MTGPPDRPHFFALTPETLRRYMLDWGLPAFRATQLLDWVYRKHVADPDAMSNLSNRDRAVIAERLDFTLGSVVQHQRATDGTQKLLVDWSPPKESGSSDSPLNVLGQLGDPSNQTECVMIPTPKRRTACISSQVGCPVGCKFCASGLGGLDGNLTAGQIVQQVWQLSHMLHRQKVGEGDEIGRITNVVFMGMGEPLANLPAVTAALQTLTADWGPNLSARKITVSTVGVVPGIRKLAKLDLPITLAISLHAPNDELRRQIIPWAKFTTVAELVDAGQDYFRETGREVTLEYILLGRFNDQPQHAQELADVASRIRGNVNLIRYNEVKGLPFDRPTTEDVRRFQDVLVKRGVNTHIRASRGRDIAAACGQLRHEASNAS
ncbi:MAG: 23S rRNA (adenine(2503)-C(2))-methyltransferase RlmN [Planctomycetota bacterium]